MIDNRSTINYHQNRAGIFYADYQQELYMTRFPKHPTTLFRRTRWQWGIALILPIVLFTAACGGSTKITKVPTTTTPIATTKVGNSTPVTNSATPVAPAITPIPGVYSIYVDPKYGYSFEYPSDWTPRPSQGVSGPYGNFESDVVVTEPYAPDPTHPAVLLLIRASNDFNADFIQHWVCGTNPSSNTFVASYPAYNGDSYGGYPKDGYEAPKMQRAFSAKGVGFEILLQGSPKASYAISSFFQIERPNFQHVLDTFTVGNGATPPGAC